VTSNRPADHERLLRVLEGLRGVTDLEAGRRDLAGLLTRAAALTREILDVPHAYLAVGLESSALMACADARGAVPRVDPWEGPGALGRLALGSREAVYWSLGGSEPPSALDILGCPRPAQWAGVSLPLVHPARGLLVALADETPDLSEEPLAILEQLAPQFAVAITNLTSFQKTEALALTDELTCLYNFRFLKTALRREMERAARYGQVFSIIMIDVDHLKRYNDEHGHLGGSELLRQLAAILSASSRAIDLVAKYGGDEFLVILPQTRLEGAATMANRIRQAVADTPFPHCRPGEMTISVGVASYPQHGDTLQTLVAAADAALFKAKRSSRNCVVAAENPGTPSGLDDLD
jgi:diguanylate cyclase (GGDEF)-like protein